MSTDHVLPLKGGWIIIKRRLPAELPQVPIFSIFWATPDRVFAANSFYDPWAPGSHLKEPDLYALYRYRHTRGQVLPHEAKRLEALDEEGYGLEMRVKIRAPDGDVWVNPYEWVPANDIRAFIEHIGKGVILHEYGDTKASRQLKERLFYMQSRGIARYDALTLMLGEIKSPSVLWLEIEKEFADVFDRDAA